MSGWKLVVYWLLPPPLILTILLILPMPSVARKGLLKVTRQFMCWKIGGQLQLLHVALTITGIAFAVTATTTYSMSREHIDPTLTPNQRSYALARKWRQERNFWIAALTFLLWGLLGRFYQLMMDHMALRERVRYLELGVVAPVSSSAAAATRVKGAKEGVEPSAPPAPTEDLKREGKKTK
ncbi:hypothetical protein VaNZ11_003958 [Volvox africanus]|uniref:BAP29/BAP31 transmembrane domain-containing protein n=1 Tax=Volvox africanus TaxID=51714 RepID=A0ABQ5RVC2_9CHLO|nr:hypothetical protein VaNZ11_003958 [Volvox africanus]